MILLTYGCATRRYSDEQLVEATAEAVRLVRERRPFPGDPEDRFPFVYLVHPLQDDPLMPLTWRFCPRSVKRWRRYYLLARCGHWAPQGPGRERCRSCSQRLRQEREREARRTEKLVQARLQAAADAAAEEIRRLI